MGKKAIRYNRASVDDVFDDLEEYLDFCKSYGYKFREENLYDMRTYPFQQFSKFNNGKKFKDQLGVDLRRFGQYQ